MLSVKLKILVVFSLLFLLRFVSDVLCEEKRFDCLHLTEMGIYSSFHRV